MSDNARLRAEIQARKFRQWELSGQIDRKIRDVLDLFSGFPLVKIKNLRLRLIAQAATEAADLQDEYLTLLSEVEAAERELL